LVPSALFLVGGPGQATSTWSLDPGHRLDTQLLGHLASPWLPCLPGWKGAWDRQREGKRQAEGLRQGEEGASIQEGVRTPWIWGAELWTPGQVGPGWQRKAGPALCLGLWSIDKVGPTESKRLVRVSKEGIKQAPKPVQGLQALS
jgi:hypothetical protein